MSDFLPAWPLLSAFLQSVTLGALFVVMALVTDTMYALAASVAAPALAHARGVRAAGRYLTGGAFIGLGVFTAFRGVGQREVTLRSRASPRRPRPRCP